MKDIDFNYSVKDYILSCNEEIIQIENTIFELRKRFKNLENLSALNKFVHRSDIKKQQQILQADYDAQIERLDIVKAELEYYEKFGLTAPSGESGGLIEDAIQKRKTKLDIINMIELGMM